METDAGHAKPNLSLPTSSAELTDEEKYKRWKAKGNGYVKAKKYEQAIEYYKRCQNIFPKKESAIYESRALALLELKDAENAIKDCSIAISINPRSENGYYRRGKAYMMLRQYDNSLSDLDSVLKINKNHSQAKIKFAEVFQLKKEEKANSKKSVHIDGIEEIKDGETVLKLIKEQIIPNIKQYSNNGEGDQDFSSKNIRENLGELENSIYEICNLNGKNRFTESNKLRASLGDLIVTQEIVNICIKIFRKKGGTLNLNNQLKLDEIASLHHAIYILYKASEYSESLRRKLSDPEILAFHDNLLDLYKTPHAKKKLDIYRESILPAIIGTFYKCARDINNRLKLRGLDNIIKAVKYLRTESPKRDIKLMANLLFAYLATDDELEEFTLQKEMFQYLQELLVTSYKSEGHLHIEKYGGQEFVRWHVYELIQGLWQCSLNETNKENLGNTKPIMDLLLKIAQQSSDQTEQKYALFAYWKLLCNDDIRKLPSSQQALNNINRLNVGNNNEMLLAKYGIIFLLQQGPPRSKPQEQVQKPKSSPRKESPDPALQSSYATLGEREPEGDLD